MSNLGAPEMLVMRDAVKKEDGSFIGDSFSQRVKNDAKTGYDGFGNAKDQGLTTTLGWLSPLIQKVSGVASAHPTATGAVRWAWLWWRGFGLASMLKLLSGSAAQVGTTAAGSAGGWRGWWAVVGGR